MVDRNAGLLCRRGGNIQMGATRIRAAPFGAGVIPAKAGIQQAPTFVRGTRRIDVPSRLLDSGFRRNDDG
jgi:hypothetical protein